MNRSFTSSLLIFLFVMPFSAQANEEGKPKEMVRGESSEKNEDVVDLATDGFEHITFDDIPETKYSTTNEGTTLEAVVDKSSSFLLKPYE